MALCYFIARVAGRLYRQGSVHGRTPDVPMRTVDGQPVSQRQHLVSHEGRVRNVARRIDSDRSRWDDAATGGAADGPPRDSPEPPALRAGRIGPRAGRRVWAAAVAGAAAGQTSQDGLPGD